MQREKKLIWFCLKCAGLHEITTWIPVVTCGGTAYQDPYVRSTFKYGGE